MKDPPPPPPPLPLKKKKKKKKKKVLDHYLYHDLGMLPLLWRFFAHLLILQYPDHHQNLISSSYSGPLHKISSQSVHNFLSNVVHRQTDKLTNATKNITSFAKEVNIQRMLSYIFSVRVITRINNKLSHLVVIIVIIFLESLVSFIIETPVAPLTCTKH